MKELGLSENWFLLVFLELLGISDLLQTDCYFGNNLSFNDRFFSIIKTPYELILTFLTMFASWIKNLVNLKLKIVLRSRLIRYYWKDWLIWKCNAGQTPSVSKESVLKWWGIRDSGQNNELETKVLTIFEKIGYEVSPRDIKACHHPHKRQWQSKCEVLTS